MPKRPPLLAIANVLSIELPTAALDVKEKEKINVDVVDIFSHRLACNPAGRHKARKIPWWIYGAGPEG